MQEWFSVHPQGAAVLALRQISRVSTHGRGLTATSQASKQASRGYIFNDAPGPATKYRRACNAAGPSHSLGDSPHRPNRGGNRKSTPWRLLFVWPCRSWICRPSTRCCPCEYSRSS